MTRADALVERGAERLQRLSRQAASSGGIKARLAPTLAEDAAFLRKLKPSLMVARARGEAPTNQEPGSDVVVPPGPQLGKRPKKNGGLNPLLVVVAAGVFLLFALGFGLAAGAAALALVVSTWLALLIVFGGVLLLALILGVFAMRAIKAGTPPVPEQAMAEAKLTTEAIKGNGAH
jgi:hypothetical protein